MHPSLVLFPVASHELQSQLHRNFGRMYGRQGKFDEALRALAQDAYYCSLASGPEDVSTATSYFLLGDVFAAKVRGGRDVCGCECEYECEKSCVSVHHCAHSVT